MGEVEGMGNREGKEESWSSCYSLVLLGKAPRPRLQGGGEKILRSQEILVNPTTHGQSCPTAYRGQGTHFPGVQEFLLVAAGKYNTSPKNKNESFKISMVA